MRRRLFLFSLLISCALASWGGKAGPRLPRSYWMRGGNQDEDEEQNKVDDEERYSRQVYTLGAKAHARVRSSVVFLDGPPESGLVYECAKNLALSGVGRISIIDQKDDTNSITTHNATLDDLGQAYQRAASFEVQGSKDENLPRTDLLVEYIRGLNPDIQVDIVQPESLPDAEKRGNSRGVILSIDRPLSMQIEMNQHARDNSMAFVGIETAGVYGKAFCDFGSQFQVDDADGEAPLVVPLDRIEAVDNEKHIIRCVDGEKHDVSKGDIIEFQLRDGSVSDVRCLVSEVHTPFRFTVEVVDGNDEGWLEEINRNAAAFLRVKVPKTISFDPLSAVHHKAISDDTLFTPSDLEKSFDATRRKFIVACFHVLEAFVKEHGRTPSLDDKVEFMQLTNDVLIEHSKSSSGDLHITNFLRSCSARLAPFQAAFGAIGSQEVLKAITGLYQPIKQILLFDCDEVLASIPTANGCRIAHSRSDCCRGLRYILGDEIVDKMQKQRVFVVGAGAIGCEVLKNLVSMGAGSLKKGGIVVTDMDTIEKSNLSRQFLFRDKDIGEFKSVAASASAVAFNDMVNIESHTSKVGEGEDQNPFTGRFWKKVDSVLNALDNVEARLYMDSQCVANGKALVDAGTLGPKGNVQAVVPHQSESYASSADPPQEEIPVCTLKNFPYAISHTIQWGRDTFKGLYSRRPIQAKQATELLTSSTPEDVASHYLRSLGSDAAVQTAAEIQEDLSPAVPGDRNGLRKYALGWAVRLADKLFRQSVQVLMEQHPIDSTDEDGEQFWSGTRRPPKQLWYNPADADAQQQAINENLVNLVRCAARLRIETMTGNDAGGSFVNQDAVDALMHATLYRDGKGPELPADKEVRMRLAKVQGRSMFEVEFEKDDDSNEHVDFVTAISNLRAVSYGIPPATKMETRKIAGNIIPAMISTTALVSALSCIEWIKLVQMAPLHLMRNSFCNLALPFFAFTSPLPAETEQGLRGLEYTLWDRIEVKEKHKDAGGITLKRLIRRLLRKASSDTSGLTVLSISYGPYLLYGSFLEEDKSVLQTSLWSVLETALDDDEDEDFVGREEDEASTTERFSPDAKYVDLSVVVEDSLSGEEIQLPNVRVKRRQKGTPV